MDRPVQAAMTAMPRVTHPDTMAAELVKMMNESRITSLFVVSDERPLGNLHLHDLLRVGVVWEQCAISASCLSEPPTSEERKMSDHLKIYVGYDSREDIAWQVCRNSLLRHAHPGLEVYPLKLTTLRELGLYTRAADTATTEFSLTRFLTPYLAAHDGWSVFVDCDFLFTTDVRSVLDHATRDRAVYVVQHDYTPAHAVKMDGQQQTTYPRKNWSSFMLFNNAHPSVKALTPEVVNTAAPAFLHRFQWLPEDSLIGELPLEWNFLEGEYPLPAQVPSAIHYTNGGPWFENWQDVHYADLWRSERDLVSAQKCG